MKGSLSLNIAKIGTGFRPHVVWLGRMNMGVVSVGTGQDVVVGRGISNLFADSTIEPLMMAFAVPFTRLLMNGALGFPIDLLDPRG